MPLDSYRPKVGDRHLFIVYFCSSSSPHRDNIEVMPLLGLLQCSWIDHLQNLSSSEAVLRLLFLTSSFFLRLTPSKQNVHSQASSREMISFANAVENVVSVVSSS